MTQNQLSRRANIKLEANSIINNYVEIVQNSCNMLSFICVHLNDIPFDNIPPPPIMGNIEFNKIEYVGDKKIYLNMWLFNHGMNDIIKAINISLGRANYLAEMSKLHSKTMLYEEYLNFEKSINKKYLKKDLPTLVSLTSNLVNKPLILIDEITSINNARKCLEHRAGIATEIDSNLIKNDKDFLEIKWIGTQLTVFRNGTDLIIDKPGFSFEKGEKITFSNINRTILYEIGERIRIDIKTFYELAYTGYLFVKHITDNYNFGNQ